MEYNYNIHSLLIPLQSSLRFIAAIICEEISYMTWGRLCKTGKLHMSGTRGGIQLVMESTKT